MTNMIDKILAVVCVLALIFSMAFFSVIKSMEEDETVSEVLSATRGYTAGIATNMKAETLHELLNDSNTSNDPFILSIRKSEHYVLGHIPGAINIPLSQLFTEENLSKLPYDEQVVVVCYTGHTASQATALINAIGYDAIALKWGMCGWCSNSTIAPYCYEKTASSTSYPVCSGTEPGTMNDAKLATPDS